MMTIITKCVWVQMVNQVKETQIGRNNYRGSKYRKQSPRGFSHPRAVEEDVQDAHRKNHGKSMNEEIFVGGQHRFCP